MHFDFDVLIIGAGPAGSAAAIDFGKTSLSVGLFDKAKFPRDKTCGDALGVDVINQLKKLSPELQHEFLHMSDKTISEGVRIFAPNGNNVDIPFTHQDEVRTGFICKRSTFDEMLFQFAGRQENVRLFDDTEINDIEIADDSVTAFTSKGNFRSKMIIGADGAHSILRRKFITSKIDRDHYSAGLRVYYKDVEGFRDGNFIELYFFKKILPGYLWIFPLPNGEANVGIGMLSAVVSAKKINLSKELEGLIKEHPILKERFRNARPIETVKGHGLPLGWKNRKISGDRFLLIGDAASLIEPFTGEGIGNAIRSGRVAVEHVNKCFAVETFTAGFNKQYDDDLYKRLKKEFSIGNAVLRLSRHAWLFNLIVNKANSSRALHHLLVDSLASPEKKQWLLKPSLYLNLLFKF